MSNESGDRPLLRAHLAFDASGGEGSDPAVIDNLNSSSMEQLGNYVLHIAASEAGICLKGEDASKTVTSGELLGYLAAGLAGNNEVSTFDAMVTKEFLGRLSKAWEVEHGQ